MMNAWDESIGHSWTTKQPISCTKAPDHTFTGNLPPTLNKSMKLCEIETKIRMDSKAVEGEIDKEVI
jgi:hypothetical protein